MVYTLARLSTVDKKNIAKLAKAVVKVLPYSNPVRTMMFTQAILNDMIIESLEWAADYAEETYDKNDPSAEAYFESILQLREMVENMERTSKSMDREISFLDKLFRKAGKS